MPSHDECVQPYQVLRWALALLPDGQIELAGVWHESSSAPMEWSEVFDDLGVRGVETIRFVDGLEPPTMSRAVSRTYPNAAAFSSMRSQTAMR